MVHGIRRRLAVTNERTWFVTLAEYSQYLYCDGKERPRARIKIINNIFLLDDLAQVKNRYPRLFQIWTVK